MIGHLVSLVIVVPLCCFFTYAFLFVGRRELDLPPGPPTVPILGNILQIPTRGTCFKFTEWAKHYGGIFSVKLGPGTAIVLTDRRLIKELIDKRGSIYSDRPQSYVFHDLITGGDHVLVARYGPKWRTCRKLITQHFMESIVERDHLRVINAEASQLVHDMMTMPEDHMWHPRRFSHSIGSSCIWGIRTPTVRNQLMKRLYSMMEKLGVLVEQGNTPPVEMLPLLHYVPERWLGNWKSRARQVRDEMNSLYGDTFGLMRRRRQLKGSTNTFMDRVLDQDDKLGFDEHQFSFLGGTLMEGASETSAGIILAGIQAFIKWPDVQKKAQAEIDSVVGEDRSPVWADYGQLPYIAQTVKEAMRWRPVTPLPFPHRVIEDDWVDGMKIPKGSLVFINAWGLHHDSTRYPDPDRFDPVHYAGVTALAPDLAARAPEERDHYGYGSGRRMCPGIHLAERNMFVAFAKLLWAFEFLPGADGALPDIDPKKGYREGSLVCPKDYGLTVRVRSSIRKEIIIREFAEAKRDVFSAYEEC